MPINQKIDVFIQFVRRSKKGWFKYIIIASIASVFLVVGSGIFILFNFYSGLIDKYYKNILYNVYDFQSRVISKENYRRDIALLAERIKSRAGVRSVWFVDRNGKCVFHSNKAILEKYLGRNLPIDYYKNINVVWKFENSYPVVVKNRLKMFGFYRLSIPLYTFGKDYYDFILGIDVSSVPISLPWLYILIFIGTSTVISIAVIFFPLWYLTYKKFDEISTQAMILGGALKAEQKGIVEEEKPIEGEEQAGGRKEKIAPEEAKIGNEKEIVSEKIGLKEEEIIKTKQEKTEVEETPGEKAKENITASQPKPEEKTIENAEKIKEKLERMEIENPNIKILELKQSIFRRKKNELSKLIVESFPYHSGSVLGSYVTVLEKDNVVWPLMFSYYNSDNVAEGYKIIKSVYDYLDNLLDGKENIKLVCTKLNDMYFEKNIKGDFSIIKISDNEVKYTALGGYYAIYLKAKDDLVKSLDLGLPQLGEIKDDFESHIKVADIEFGKNDMFIAMPPNAKRIKIDNGTLDELIRRYLAEYRDDFDKMGKELNNILKSYFRKDRGMEETGFIAMRFLQ